MKKLQILSIVALAGIAGVGLYAFGIQHDAPSAVKEAFSQKFPTIKKVKWDKESDTEWEAEFTMDGIEYSANFMEDGTWKETEHLLVQAAIPALVSSALKSEFPGYAVEEAEISESNEGSLYEFELEKGKQELEVTIDGTGKVVKQASEDGDEED